MNDRPVYVFMVYGTEASAGLAILGTGYTVVGCGHLRRVRLNHCLAPLGLGELDSVAIENRHAILTTVKHDLRGSSDLFPGRCLHRRSIKRMNVTNDRHQNLNHFA